MKDFNIYKLRLSQSLEDKLFFMDKLDLSSYDLVVDFGCGTGTVLNAIYQRLQNKNRPLLVGYDNSVEMLNFAAQSTSREIQYINSMDTLEVAVQSAKKSMIIFNSVLHEMDEFQQRKILNTIMTKFTTVVVRDMKRPLNNEPISNITRKRVLAQVALWQAQLFESRWGKIRDKETLYRFFLMNEFVENFETEVEEDYFGVLWSDIAWRLKPQYECVYEHSFTLPYRKQQVKKRFNHVMHDITHRKVIFTRSTAQEGTLTNEKETSLSN